MGNFSLLGPHKNLTSLLHSIVLFGTKEPERNIYDPNTVGIMHLPDELMECIFLEIHLDGMWNGAAPGWRERDKRQWTYPWVRICRVCRRWYEIAIRFPPLWTTMPSARSKGFTRVTHIPLFLERSGSHGLSINMQLQDKIETSNALKKYQILDRLVCANFQLGNIPTRGDDDAATMTTLMDAPHLREINVYDGYACPPSFIPFSRGKLPMLTTLRILAPLPKEYILPLWRDTVTHLELCVQQSIWEDFITMLKQLQNLEFLSLENSLPSVYQADRISLPNLRRLRIVDWLDRIAFGSTYFELDSEKMRNINYICYFRSKEKGSLWSFCRSLRSFLNTSILHLRVRRLNITDLEVTGWKKIESQSGEAHFRIELQRFTGRATKGEDRASFFKTLLEELRAFRMYPVTISLEDRTVLSHPEKFPGMDFDRDLNDVFGSPSHDICHTFHALPSVTSIYVDFFLAYGFIQKLFNLNIDDWRKLRECFVEGSDLPHWTEVESDSDQPSVITEETLKLPNKLTTIGITGGKSKCFEDAEIILRNAAEESPVVDSTVVIYVKS